MKQFDKIRHKALRYCENHYIASLEIYNIIPNSHMIVPNSGGDLVQIIGIKTL